ncbi:hypothetical protein DR85_1524 [Francisella tularensis]|nr:hypothetical protein DR85_1524 [Francisella tularensis]
MPNTKSISTDVYFSYYKYQFYEILKIVYKEVMYL